MGFFNWFNSNEGRIDILRKDEIGTERKLRQLIFHREDIRKRLRGLKTIADPNKLQHWQKQLEEKQIKIDECIEALGKDQREIKALEKQVIAEYRKPSRERIYGNIGLD
ncbi:MAG: hypothetical protein IH934_05605 [Nanoarchaeota archaeon]|nr:hypothetical protein [Nanoarchaeota archaeon]